MTIATRAPLPDTRHRAAAPAAARAFRNPDGLWLEEDAFKLAAAVDNKPLDLHLGEGYMAARRWQDPTCPSSHFSSQYVRMVPHRWRSCDKHGTLPLPPADPYPMGVREMEFATRRERARAADRLQLPVHLRGADLVRSEQTHAIRAVREFLEDDDAESRCMALAGPTGVGKTWAMVAGVLQLAIEDREFHVEYFTVHKLSRLLIRPGSDEILERAIEADILALDDVGAASIKEGGVAEASLEEILVERESRERGTWLTTNLTAAAFRVQLGDRLADRIICGAWGEWCALPGSSLRRKDPR